MSNWKMATSLFPLKKVWIRMRKIRRPVSISDVNVMPAA